jgi:hypothetical protein
MRKLHVARVWEVSMHLAGDTFGTIAIVNHLHLGVIPEWREEEE